MKRASKTYITQGKSKIQRLL